MNTMARRTTQAVKARVRALSLAECRETARLALDARSAAEVRAIVDARHPEDG